MTLLLLPALYVLAQLTIVSTSLSLSSSHGLNSYLITGANKGQGFALCSRILAEHSNTHVFLCSRDYRRGQQAKSLLLQECLQWEERIDVVLLDVTSDASVTAALRQVQQTLELRSTGESPLTLAGIVSNAGILWGYPLPQLMDVCVTGVRRVLEAFLPLLEQKTLQGRVVVVTSGLSPLMHQYSGTHRQRSMMSPDCTWEQTLLPIRDECLTAYTMTQESTLEERIQAFEAINFGGGPFASTAPDFHMYGLAKMLGDAYMLFVSRKYPTLRVMSVDPGLVYTDLILKMPKYRGKTLDETGAQSPREGVEATMRVLFEEEAGREEGSGKIYAMNHDKTQLVFSTIDKMPQKQ